MAQPSFSLVTGQQVTGVLKATGSRDPDVLFAAKQSLLEPVRPLKFIGLWAYVMGGLLTVLILTAVIGIPVIAFGWWVRRRAKHNIEAIETTFREYVDSVARQAVPA